MKTTETGQQDPTPDPPTEDIPFWYGDDMDQA
jgi:hypothetical protein